MKISEDFMLFSGDRIAIRLEPPYPGYGPYLYSDSKGWVLPGSDTVTAEATFEVEVNGDQFTSIRDHQGRRLYVYDSAGNYPLAFYDTKQEFISEFDVHVLDADKKIVRLYFIENHLWKGSPKVWLKFPTWDKRYTFVIERVGVTGTEHVSDVEFDMKNLTKSTENLVIGQQTLINNYPVEQTMSFEVSKTVSTEKAFTWENGVTVGASFSVSVPSVEVTASVETSFTNGGSESTSESKTFTAAFPVKCLPNSSVTAKAMVTLGTVKVPYTMKVTRELADGEKYTYDAKGMFTGTDAFNLKYVVEGVR